MNQHITGVADPGHCTWFQAQTEDVRKQHVRASHWPMWRANPDPLLLTAEAHRKDHAAR